MHATKVKLTMVLLVTLGLGFTIGYLVRDVAMRAHFRGMEKMREGKGITEMIENQLNLTPPQKDQLSTLVRKYSVRLRTIHQNFRRDLTATLDSMKNEMSPYLTDEQKKRMIHHDMGPGMMPPPGGPPMQMDPERFIRHFSDMIEPTDEQRDTVLTVLRKYAPSGRPGEDVPPEMIQKRMNELFRELEPILTQEQILRIKKMDPFFHMDTAGDYQNDSGNPKSAASNEDEDKK
jgi:hypothetical protein